MKLYICEVFICGLGAERNRQEAVGVSLNMRSVDTKKYRVTPNSAGSKYISEGSQTYVFYF